MRKPLKVKKLKALLLLGLISLKSSLFASNYFTIDLTQEASIIVSNGWSLPLQLNPNLNPKDSILYTKNCFTYNDNCYPATFRHGAIDLFTKNQKDEPVYAIDDGTILDSFTNDRVPNTSVIYVEHATSSNEKFIAVYGHVQIINNLKEDSKVKQGQLIGHVKPFNENHLHLEITDKDGETDQSFGGLKEFHYDPLKFLQSNKNDSSCTKFSDISTNKYKNEICAIAKEKLVNGYSDGTYKPDKSINRAEFTKIIVTSIKDYNSYSVKDRNENLFDDVATDAWFSEFIYYAKDESIINGKEDKKFHPSDDINYAEASKIIVKALLKNNNIPSSTDDAWYKPFIEKLENKGISFSPYHKLTRGEMAYLIHSVCTSSKDNLCK